MRLKLIFILFLLCPVLAFATPPQAVDARYDQASHRLSVRFDQSVFGDSTSLRIGAMTVDDDNGGQNANISFTGVGYSSTRLNDSTVTVDLTYLTSIDSYEYEDPGSGQTVTAYCWGTQTAGLQAFEALTNRNSLRLILDEGFTRSNANELSAATSATGVPITFVVNSNPPQLLSAVYRAQTNELALTFDRAMKFDVIAEDRKMNNSQSQPVLPGNGILDPGEDRNGNGVLDIEPNLRISQFAIASPRSRVELAGGEVVTLLDTSTMVVKLSLPNRRSVEALTHDSLRISFPPFAIVDQNYRATAAVNAALTYLPETSVLRLDSASYDYGYNFLKLYFNAALDATNSDILYGRIGLGGVVSGRDTIWSLAGGSPTLFDNNHTLQISLLPSDQRNVEELGLQNGPMILSMLQGAVTSAEGNDNQAIRTAVTQIVETTSAHAPHPTAATYTAATNILSVTFDVTVSNTSSQVVLAGFGVDDSLHTTRYLTGGTFRRLTGNRILEITLTDSDEVRLESLGNKTGWKLRLQPFSVLQLSRLNGNRIDSVRINYIADTLSAPLLEELFVNRDEGTMRFKFTKATTLVGSVSGAISLSGLDLGAMALDTTNRMDTVISKYVTLKLSSADVARVRALSGTNLTAPYVTIDSNIFRNLDNRKNPRWSSISTGQSLTSPTQSTSLLMGIGRTFWVKSKEAFASPDRKAYAIIRKSSVITASALNDTTELYIDLLLFRPYAKNRNHIPIKQTMIDSLWRFVSERSLVDTTKSAYELVAGFVGRGYENLLPSYTAIVWTDIADEFSMNGRNDTNQDFFSGTMFNSNDQLRPSETTAHTNNIDMVYLDGWPQTVNSNDTSWSVKSSSTNADTIRYARTKGSTAYNAITNGLAKLFQYKVDRYEQAWEVEGLAGQAEFLTTGHVDFYGAGTAKTPADNSSRTLTFLGTGLKVRDDYFNNALFFSYLNEQYGGYEFMRRLAASRLTGVTAISSVLTNSQDIIPADNRGRSLEQIYLDFATAVLVDTTNSYLPTADQNRFMIRAATLNTALTGKTGKPLKWRLDPPSDIPPYSSIMNGWSYDINYILYSVSPQNPENPLLNPARDSIFINTVDSLNCKARIVWISSPILAATVNNDFATMDFSFDQRGVGAVPVGPTLNGRSIMPGSGSAPMKVMAVIVAKTDNRTAGAQGDYLITRSGGDTLKSFGFTVEKDPASNRYLGLWVASNERLFNTSNVEAPEVAVTNRTTQSHSTIVLQNVYGSATANDFTYLYSARTRIEEHGSYSFDLRALRATGRSVTVNPFIGTINSIGGGETMLWETGSITAPTTYALGTTWAINEQVAATASGLNKLSFQPQIIHIGPERSLDESAVLTLSIPASLTGQDVAIFRFENNVWYKVGGTRNGSQLTARVARLGRFAVMPASTESMPSADAGLPLSYSIGEAYPNPFNGSVVVPVSLPDRSDVTLAVYNVLGQMVSFDHYRDLAPGRHDLRWRTEAPSGVYFARVTTAGSSRTLKLVRVQ